MSSENKTHPTLPDELAITLVTAFCVYDSERNESNRILGYFRDETVANVAAKGAASYGNDYSVCETEVYTDGKSVFKVTIVSDAGFMDDNPEYNAELIEQVKSKLTEDERKLLRIE